MNIAVLVVDSVVKLPPEANGAVVVGGSNATIYAADFSARAGARAATASPLSTVAKAFLQVPAETVVPD